MSSRADTVRRTLEFCRRHDHFAEKAEVWVPPIALWKQLEGEAERVTTLLEQPTTAGCLSARRGLLAKLSDLKRRQGVRRDLFGFVDVVCLDDGPGSLYIQTTTPSNYSAHIRKMEEQPLREAVAAALRKNRVTVALWKRVKVRKKDGTIGKAVRWRPSFVMIDGWEGPEDIGGWATTTTDLPYGWTT